MGPTHPSIRALGLKLQEEKARPGYGQYHQRRRMPAASTSDYVKAMQEKIMDKKAASFARTYGGQLEASSKKPLRTSFPQISPRIKALQKQIMDKKAEILARHPEYDTWAEYKVKEQAKADKLQGQYRQRRRMPAASIHPRIRALQMKLQQERAATRARTYGGQLEASRNAPRRTPSPQTSSAINAIHMKLQQEKAAILAKTYDGQLEASRNAPRR